MSVSLIIGAQWGDEGKGKIIDALAASSDVVVRFHGGNNAGHTIINKHGTFPMHMLPSGVFSPRTKACITNGVVVDLDILTQEIDMVTKAGFKLEGRLFISPRCHLIMPYHKVLDRLYEEAKGTSKIGTTGRGIGPVYADKMTRNAIRVVDLLDKKDFTQKLSQELRLKNKIIIALGGEALDQKEIEASFFKLREKVMQYISEPFPLLHKAIEKKKKVLFEGAQGVFLDNDWGTYPYVTSSTVLAGGANASAGIPLQKITTILGVVKAYTTRVGAGPFPTELFDADGQALQTIGKEFGATTGRTRRCGWFDAELIRFAALLNGFTEIALTKLDVLDTFKEIKVCTGYMVNGKKVHYYDGDAVFLSKIKPVYKTFPGWQKSTKGITEFTKLPSKAKAYIKAIETLVGVKATYISNRPRPARNDSPIVLCLRLISVKIRE